MRLLTAIPLLFWASTTAMAHLAVLWATEPAAAVTHTASQDSALEPASHDQVFAHPAPVHPVVATVLVPQTVERDDDALPVQPGFEGSLRRRILAASRLLANPPPFGV